MKILPPTNCPSCGSELERVNDQLFCKNTNDCPAQTTKRLQNFCKKLKIKGFGEATLNTLGLSDINELLELEPKALISRGYSELMANKLVDSVNSRVQQGLSPNEFLAALSIPLIGDGAMRKLKFTKISDITFDMCREAGIGEKAANNLIKWVAENWDTYKQWESYFEAPKENIITSPTLGITVCITGKLDDFKNRSEAAEFLTNKGFEVKTSVTKAVQYLICEDGTQGSSYKKAVSNNIKILTIKELLEDNL